MTNLPSELLQQLNDVAGFNKSAFVAAHQQQAVTSVRLHPEKNILLQQHTEQIPWCETGRYLMERPVFTLNPSFHAGCYYVQEASSMFLDFLFRKIFPERKNLRVLDLCAAPGGKSTLLASLLEEESLLISNEVIRSRASVLEENLVRWGYRNNWATSNDPHDFGKLQGYFAAIIIDAPCSGSGLFRKDKKVIDDWSKANVMLCSRRQQRIIADVWSSLKEDGVLIYATCSYSQEEDEEILDWLAETYNVESIFIPTLPEWGIVTTISAKHKMNGYRFFPDKIKGEGFFIAAVRKKENTMLQKYPRFKTQHDKKAAEQSAFLLQEREFICLAPDKEDFATIHPAHEADYQLLKSLLYFRKMGTALGSMGHKEWLPAHDTALSVDKNEQLPKLAFNKEQALRFLKKEEININVAAKGWYLAAFGDDALGWIKSLGNRYNNYLPKNWRIRMNIDFETEE